MVPLIAIVNFISITLDDMYGSLNVIIQSLTDIKTIILRGAIRLRTLLSCSRMYLLEFYDILRVSAN